MYKDMIPKYWIDGTKLIEKCLATAVESKWENAPFPLDEEQAALWHRAQLEAYRHALEMMGVPEYIMKRIGE